MVYWIGGISAARLRFIITHTYTVGVEPYMHVKRTDRVEYGCVASESHDRPAAATNQQTCRYNQVVIYVMYL